MACASPVTWVPTGMLLPGRGLANAQGLYQLVRVRIWGAQVTLGFVGFGAPPAANGFPAKKVLAVPPPAVLMLGVTANGFPVSAWNITLDDHPPAMAFSSPPRLRNLRPEPKGKL